MRIKIFFPALAFLLSTSFACFAQRNPYKELGKKEEVLTLTKGEYEEFFDDEDVQQIGTALINIRTNKIVKLLTKEEAEKRLESTMGERFLSVDPLTNNYPWYTPYQYAGNTPIQAIDLDGLEEWVVTRWYDKDQQVTKIRIFTVVDNKANTNHVNLHFKSKGDELAKGNKVLYLHLNAGTNKIFSQPTFGSALTKDEQKLFESNKKKAVISDETYWTLDHDYKNYRTVEDDNLKTKYTEYNAFGQFNISPPRKPEAVKETNTYGSSIGFWPSTASTKGSVQSEVNNILSLVKGKSDYNITILGNFNGATSENFNTEANILSKVNGYKTYGDLALARANEIKGLLIDAGLDASKIKTQLGNSQGGINANYIITTVSEKK